MLEEGFIKDFIDEKGRGLRPRSITFKGKSGFPTGIYFSTIDILEAMGYTVQKVNDWIEVNPRSDFYDDIVQKKQTVEQQVARVLSTISETRKELELLRHDKRKLDRIVEHKENDDIDVLKSDFVDLVDRNTDMSLLNLANSGRFPSIVVDFYKIEDEDDIDKLEVSRGEKQVLRKKWQLFLDWKKRYVGEIERKKNMIDSELRSKEASLESLEDSLKPYARALERIKLSDPNEYKGLRDPKIVERYPGSIVGVELCAWKELSLESVYADHDRIEPDVVDSASKRGESGYEFFSFMYVNVSKKSLIVSGKDKEGINIKVMPALVHRKDMNELRDAIDEREKELIKSIKRLGGGVVEEEEEECEEERVMDRLKDIGRRILMIPDERSAHPSHEKQLKIAIEEDVDKLYEKIKEAGGGLKLWKLRKGKG